MIRQLIKEGDTKDASEKIFEFINLLKKIESDTIHLLNRANSLQSENNKGMVSNEDKSLEMNQLTMTTIYSCQQIEEIILKYFPNLSYSRTSATLEEQLAEKLRSKYSTVTKMVDGASASFFQAKQMDTQRLVILRVSKQQNFGEQDISQEELKGIAKVLQIKHRNIIKVLNSDFNGFPKLLELEYIHGRSVDHLIRGMRFSIRRSLSIFRQLSEAIYYLHINGIAHKNIKPDKILIDSELIPVISHFDIVSSKSEKGGVIRADQLLYASPEVLKNQIEDGDYKSDQFSLGVVMYEIISGEQLFGQKISEEPIAPLSIHSVVENRLHFFRSKKERSDKINKLNAPRAVKSIILKMISEDPDDRYENMKEVIDELEKVKIPIGRNTEIALDSYERCCISNLNFIEEFYQELFEKSEYKDEMNQFFSASNANKVNRSRFKMLRVAIDLLIHCKREPEKLNEILRLDVHTGIDNRLYKSFVDLIIDMIKRNDPLWREEDKNSIIGNAWEEVKQSFYGMLGEG